MLKHIGSYDAKTKLPEILRRVESGERFTITNRGKAIADLIPSQEANRSQVQNAIAQLLKNRKIIIADAELHSLKNEGRK